MLDAEAPRRQVLERQLGQELLPLTLPIQLLDYFFLYPLSLAANAIEYNYNKGVSVGIALPLTLPDNSTSTAFASGPKLDLPHLR